MSKLRVLSGLILFSRLVCAHPMGNFSINHYARLEFGAKGFQLTYILDFAEIPTFELSQQWGVTTVTQASIGDKCTSEANVWLQNLALSVDHQPVPIKLEEVTPTVYDGAGGLPVLRVEMKASAAVTQGLLVYQDLNYVNRTGWKEIVISKGFGILLQNASHSDRDLSHGLTVYPADLTVTPPQDLRASVRWEIESPGLTKPIAPAVKVATVQPKPSVHLAAVSHTPVSLPEVVRRTGDSFTSRLPMASGMVNRGDFLSKMLTEKRFGLLTILLGIAVAFGLGAMHALSPGHGKTIVAAYLVGSRGTFKHAVLLGFVVTFTHTISVFLLGLGVLFFQKYIVPDQVVPILGAASGVSIVVLGGWLLYKRSTALLAATAHSHHHDHHDHAHHNHDHHHHSHEHDRHHTHSHHQQGHTNDHNGVFTHTHDGHTHSHAMPGRITLGSLIALGASGGLVPCPSALLLLLSAIALGRTGLGLALLTGFSAGLAVVLTGIGALVLYAKNLLPQTHSAVQHRAVRLLPVFSSVVIIILGLFMTLTAVNLIHPVRLFS